MVHLQGTMQVTSGFVEITPKHFNISLNCLVSGYFKVTKKTENTEKKQKLEIRRLFL